MHDVQKRRLITGTQKDYWTIILTLGDNPAEWDCVNPQMGRVKLEEAGSWPGAHSPGQGWDESPDQPDSMAACCFSFVHTFDLRIGDHQNDIALRK